MRNIYSIHKDIVIPARWQISFYFNVGAKGFKDLKFYVIVILERIDPILKLSDKVFV